MTELQEKVPLHQQWPQRWELNEPTPDLLEGYLRWVLDDPDTAESAVRGMDTYGPGFRGLVVAVERDPVTGVVTKSIQINLYRGDFEGDNGPHAHSRDAVSTLFTMPGSEQYIVRHHVLDASASNDVPEGFGNELEERVAVAMCIGDRGDGRQPNYNPVVVGRQLVLTHSEVHMRPMGSVFFSSTEVHHVGYRGDDVGISVHRKGPEELTAYNTAWGFQHIKNLPEEVAKELVRIRRRMVHAEQLGEGAIRLAPSTMIYPTEDRVEALLNRTKIPKPTLEVATDLLVGALRTAAYVRSHGYV